MKKILLAILLISHQTFALTINDLKEPKPMMGRVSNADALETQTTSLSTRTIKAENKKIELIQKTNLPSNNTAEEKKETEQEITPQKEVIATTTQNYADLSLKRLADDISFELEQDTQKTNSDLNILWIAATERSETMKYTIYKLSNPDEDKPNESAVKKILKPIANFSSLIGASVASDPYVATGALIGGGLAGAFMKDDKEINYQFSKISDTDMVLLIRKIDQLQKRMLDLYIDFKSKEKMLHLAAEDLDKKELNYQNHQNSTKEELMLADMYYREAKTTHEKSQDEFLIAKTILENLVGLEAVKQISEQY